MSESISPDQIVSELTQQISFFRGSGQHDRVERVSRELLALEPDNGWVHYVLAEALTDLERYDDAEEHVMKSIVLAPDYANAYGALARLKLNQNRAGAADDAIRKAIQLDPEDVNSSVTR